VWKFNFPYMHISSGEVQYVIIVCSSAEENCPRIYPGVQQRLYWPFEDPAAFVGSQEETLNKFREVRDQIEARVKAWVEEQASVWS
jgi:arsenate reductase (thioredoxin)